MQLRLLATLFLPLMLAYGQAISGDVTGSISDASGGLILNASVTNQND